MGKRHAFGLCLGMLGLLTVPHQNTRQGREAFAVTSAELRRLHGEVAAMNQRADEIHKWYDVLLDRAEQAEAEVERLRAVLRDLVQLEADGRTEYESAIEHWDKARAALKEAK